MYKVKKGIKFLGYTESNCNEERAQIIIHTLVQKNPRLLGKVFEIVETEKPKQDVSTKESDLPIRTRPTTDTSEKDGSQDVQRKPEKRGKKAESE